MTPLYLFDMDGTILDSMPFWEHLGQNYLLSKNITPPADLKACIETMTMKESADYFIRLGLSMEQDDIVQDIENFMIGQYRDKIPMKPAIVPVLEQLHRNHAAMCLVTTSRWACAAAALRRLGILHYFREIYTGDELGLGKQTPEIYETVCQLQGFTPSQAIVYEDAPYAIRSAKAAGCRVIAVPENYYQGEWEEICSTADEIL